MKAEISSTGWKIMGALAAVIIFRKELAPAVGTLVNKLAKLEKIQLPGPKIIDMETFEEKEEKPRYLKPSGDLVTKTESETIEFAAQTKKVAPGVYQVEPILDAPRVVTTPEGQRLLEIIMPSGEKERYGITPGEIATAEMRAYYQEMYPDME